MAALEDRKTEDEGQQGLFQSCQEVSDADWRLLEECAAEKIDKEEITDVLLERLVMQGWQVYQGRMMFYYD